MKILSILLLLKLMFWSQAGFAEDVGDAAKQQPERPLEIVVYRSPTCGCCKKWIAHLQQNQFTVKDIVTEDIKTIKSDNGVPANMSSCHTAIIDGYVVEGHVPAADIKKLITIKPKVIGLSVPGMVTGSPGMEMGARRDPFQVISFDAKGENKVFNEYRDY